MIYEFIFSKNIGSQFNINRMVKRSRLFNPADSEASILAHAKTFLDTAIEQSNISIPDEILHAKELFLKNSSPEFTVARFKDICSLLEFYGFSYYVIKRMDITEVDDTEEVAGRFYTLFSEETIFGPGTETAVEAIARTVKSVDDMIWPSAVMSAFTDLNLDKDVRNLIHLDEEQKTYNDLMNIGKPLEYDSTGLEKFLKSRGYQVMILLEN